MADLIAIGYDDKTTAASAANEVARLTRELVVAPDAVAVIVREEDGRYKATTSHHPVGAGTSFGMFWGLLLGVLFDREFQDEVRDFVRPGTSALFVVVEKGTPDKAVEGLSRFGGTVLRSSLSKTVEHQVQDTLHVTAAAHGIGA